MCTPLKRICRYTLFQVEFLETVPRKNTMRDISKDFNWLIETFFSGELVVRVVLVVLVVSGVQHVDCVTFCTSSFSMKGVTRERGIER